MFRQQLEHAMNEELELVDLGDAKAQTHGGPDGPKADVSEVLPFRPI